MSLHPVERGRGAAHMRQRCASLLLVLLAALSSTRPVAGWQTGGTAFAPLQADGNGVRALARPFELRAAAEPLADVLRRVTLEANLDLVFRSDLPGLERRVTVTATTTVAGALLAALRGLPLSALVSADGRIVIVAAADSGDVAGRATVAAAVAVAGVVREADSGAPVDVATVELDGVRTTTTDGAGRFRFADVAPGAHTLVVQRLGYRAAGAASVQVAAGADAHVEIALDIAPTPLAAVIVTPGTYGMLERGATSRQSLSREQIETQPQLGDDVFRAVNRLPGVSSQDFSAAFGVRGGTHRELLVRLDGLELIEPFHLKDFESSLSIIDVGSIGGVDLITGGFGAEYGNRLTGVFDMRTVPVAPEGVRTSLGLSLTNVRASSQGAFGGQRGRWLVTARRGYLDLALDLADANEDLSPTYYDVLGKVEYALTPRTIVSAHVLHAGDDLRAQDESDSAVLDSEYGSSYAWLNVDARPHERISAFTVLAAGRLTWERLADLDSPIGPQPWHRRPGMELADRRAYEFVGVRQEWSFDLGERLLLKAGFDARRAAADYNYFSWRQRFIASDGQVLTHNDTTIVDVGPDGTALGAYLAPRLRPWQPLTLEVGAEWSRHGHADASKVNPRLNAALALGRTTLRAAWGRYTQVQGLHELPVTDGVARFFPAERAEHRVGSIEHALPGGLDLRLEAYERRIDDPRPRFVNLDNVDDLFPELTPSRSRIDADAGRARGIELVARETRGAFTWSASYALASVEERIAGAWVPGPRDQRHAFALDGVLVTGRAWHLAASWQYHTGWPYTPQTATLDSVEGGYLIGRGYEAYNSATLPSYHRMDVRVSRHFDRRRGRVSVFLDVWNLYDRGNARAVYTNVHGIRDGRPLTNERVDTLLPRLPSFGVFWEF